MNPKRLFLAAIALAAAVNLVAADTSLARSNRRNRSNRNRRRQDRRTRHYKVNAKVTSVKRIGTATGKVDLAARHREAFPAGGPREYLNPLLVSELLKLRAAAAETEAAKTNNTDWIFIKR